MLNLRGMPLAKQVARRLSRWWHGPAVIVVSGLPRSGTSMMMRMLEAGGISPLSDGVRAPDVDNPFGYYEDQRAMDLAGGADKRWVREARGRALKVISHLLVHLPHGHAYDVILMRRELGEVVTSQNRMLERRGELNPLDDRATRERFERHLEGVRRMLSEASAFAFTEVDFGAALRDPCAVAQHLAQFLGRELDVDAMCKVVDPSLARSGSAARAGAR